MSPSRQAFAEPVLVTGGSGFIGARLVARLRELGVAVVAPRSTEMDIRRFEQVEAMLEQHRPRTLFHLASDSRGRRECETFLEVFGANTVGTVHVLEACRRTQVERLIVTGTGDELGSGVPTTPEPGALSAPKPGAFSASGPRPRSVYAASKAAATLLCEAAARFCDLRPTVLRLYAVYGPGQPLEFLIPSLVQALRTGEPLSMTGGEQRRDFLWLDDVVEVLLAAACEPRCAGRTLDVCSGRTYSLRELVELLSALSGRPVPAVFGAMPYRGGELFTIRCDPAPLQEVIGPLLGTSLEDGLRQLLAQSDLLR